MAEPERYDAVVIGSGEGGKYLAWHLAQSGRRTAVVERRWIGGSCPNINCLPSKNEIWSAGEFGVTTGPVSIDMAKVLQRKRDMVDGLIAFHLERYKASGAELIMGNARLVASKTVEVALNSGGTRRLSAGRLFLTVGTHARIPPVPGLAEAQPLTNIEALELDRLPDHLIVLDGGYVGPELAQAYRRFGSHVTVIEHGPRLAGREDLDVSDEVRGILEAEGVAVRVATLPIQAVLRTRTTSKNAGFMKALVGDDDRIAGFTMIGAEAGEVMAVVQTAIMGRLPYTTMRDAILTHPTMAEGLNALFSNVLS